MYYLFRSQTQIDSDRSGGLSLWSLVRGPLDWWQQRWSTSLRTEIAARSRGQPSSTKWAVRYLSRHLFPRYLSQVQRRPPGSVSRSHVDSGTRGPPVPVPVSGCMPVAVSTVGTGSSFWQAAGAVSWA